jgi:small nuclear ribonucleoprotein G
LKFYLNGNRNITGTLRGYDAFLNVALEEAEHEGSYLGTIVIRGNSIIKLEGMERIAVGAPES